jgi:hypothetical protein
VLLSTTKAHQQTGWLAVPTALRRSVMVKNVFQGLCGLGNLEWLGGVTCRHHRHRGHTRELREGADVHDWWQKHH